MTICASVKARDGLIFATDSMTTIQLRDNTGQVRTVQSYPNARKLFQVGDLPIGVMTYGAGNIGQLSIEGIVRSFRPRSNQRSPRLVAGALYRHIRGLYDAEFGGMANPPSLGIFVGGYRRDAAFAEEWEFLLPRDARPIQTRAPEIFGLSWRGIEVPVTRLIKGYDPRILGNLASAGIPPPAAQALLTQYETTIVYDGMPVQDAVDLATFIIRTTVGIARFEIGPDSCGGPVQLAAILPDSGFRWIARPTLSVKEGLVL